MGYLRFLIAIILLAGCSESTDEPTGSYEHFIRVPVDVPTIQAGIDRAGEGDTVFVAAGEYSGPGNREIDFGGKTVVLLSEDGPLATTIDCRDHETSATFAFTGISGDGRVIIDGFTITGAKAAQGPVFNLKSASPIVRNCIISDNTAEVSGGAIRCKDASPSFINCTFVNNGAPIGGTIYVLAGSVPTFTNCIIASTDSGGAVGTGGGDVPTFSCSNLYGNVGGDWSGVLAPQADSSGNMSADPLFCADGDARLQQSSPCRPENNDCGLLIGATGDGCDESAVTGR